MNGTIEVICYCDIESGLLFPVSLLPDRGKSLPILVEIEILVILNNVLLRY